MFILIIFGQIKGGTSLFITYANIVQDVGANEALPAEPAQDKQNIMLFLGLLDHARSIT